MELETFFTELYVIVDNFYKSDIEGRIKKHAGAQACLSDSEVLTIAGQWRMGVAWASESKLIPTEANIPALLHHIGIFLNGTLGRPLHALATLIC